MPRCCKKAEGVFDGPSHFGLNKTDLFVLCCDGYTYAIDIKFCPFCGKNLNSRFSILKAEDTVPYWVYDGTKTVGLFESREAAEAYVLLH